MKNLKQILATALTLCLLSAGALALEPQRGDEQKRPPKESKEVPNQKDKREPPPPSNNSNKGDGNKRGKP